MLEKLGDGNLKVILDSTLPFTETGVQTAFAKVSSGHAHGKVVVKIS